MNELDIARFEEQELGQDERNADQIANAINKIKAEVQEAVLTGAIRIGRELQAAKSKVPYGEWENWLKTYVDYSPRTAQNLMRIADEYGRMHSEAMEGLSITQATALLGLTAEQKEEFVATHDMETTTTDELKAQVKELKEQLAGKQQTIDGLMEDVAQLSTASADREAEKELAEMHAQLRAAEERAAEAEAKAAEVEKSAEYSLELKEKAIRDESKAKQEKAQLEIQLQAYKQRAEVAEKQKERTEEQLLEERAKGPKIEYRTDPETEKELAQLRAAAGRGEDEIVLRELIGELGGVLDKIGGRIARIRVQDAEKAAKMSAAVAQLLEKRAEAMRG